MKVYVVEESCFLKGDLAWNYVKAVFSTEKLAVAAVEKFEKEDIIRRKRKIELENQIKSLKEGEGLSEELLIELEDCFEVGDKHEIIEFELDII